MIRIPSNNSLPAVEIDMEICDTEEGEIKFYPKIRAFDSHGFSLGVVMLDGIEQLTALRSGIDQLITAIAINKSLNQE